MTAESPPMTEKQSALDAIARMPDAATLIQIRNELDLLEAIREGEADLDAGRTVTHEEVMRKSAEWLTR
jgi:predicted transcriptional regulator